MSVCLCVSERLCECVKVLYMRVSMCREVEFLRFMSKGRFATQPADDTSEGTVRSNMEIHRCHRLHTEKEERVMLSLVNAYLAWDSSACQMDLPLTASIPK